MDIVNYANVKCHNVRVFSNYKCQHNTKSWISIRRNKYRKRAIHITKAGEINELEKAKRNQTTKQVLIII